MIDHEGYTGVFEFDPGLRLFTGHAIDLRDEVYVEGDSVEALEASMARAVDHYLEVCKEREEEPGRPFSGTMNVRLGSELHRAAAVSAAAQGESLNTWLSRVVEEATRGARQPRAPRGMGRVSGRRKSASAKVPRRDK